MRSFVVTVMVIYQKYQGVSYMMQSFIIIARDEGQAINEADRLFSEQHRIDAYLDRNFSVIEIGEKDEEALQ